MPLRNPSANEMRLLQHLISLAPGGLVASDWLMTLRVESLSDDGMGSLAIYPATHTSSNRTFGRQVSECRFQDADGVDVVASLNTDSEGKIFELDLWKTDFSSLIKIPDKFE